MPSAENCLLQELDIAAGAAVSLRSQVRMMAIKALLMGNAHIVKALMAMGRRFVRRIGAALAAVCNSSREQFSRSGMFLGRDVPHTNQ
jgi:hypothetical protein